MPRPIEIFISYAHADPPLFRDLLLELLHWPESRVRVRVRLWTDANIRAGSLPDQHIRAALASMQVFVPLITPFFDASDYIQKVEVPIAKNRHLRGEILIAPVVVSHPGEGRSRWLMRLSRLPNNSETWAEIRHASIPSAGYDKALGPVREGIRKLVEVAQNGGILRK